MKFCSNCGKECSDETKFCPVCGSPVADRTQPMNYYQESGNQKTKTNGYAIASLVLSLCGIFTGFVAVAMALMFVNMGIAFLFLIPTLLGPVFGIIALVKVYRDPAYKGTGMAVAGIVVGGIAFTIFFIACNVTLSAARLAYGYFGTDIYSDIFSLFDY